MIVRCTGAPSVELEAEQLMVTIPSGREDILIALSIHQAVRLGHAISRQTIVAMGCDQKARKKAKVYKLSAEA